MILKSLVLRNFRIYEDAEMSFDQGMNTIIGPNACGKTTVLEAIYTLIAGRSFRTGHFADLVRHSADSFFIEAVFEKQGIEQRLRIHSNGKKRSILHNQTACSSTAELLGILLGVVLTPDHASLVKGGPSMRRQFIDLQVAQVDPLYVHHLLRYHRAMRHRNTLLKQRSDVSIDGWEEEMAKSAAYLSEVREKAVRELEETARRFLLTVTGEKEELALEYRTVGRAKEVESYLEQFRRHREREKVLGYTLTGPHKDDILIAIGGKDTRYFASEGQQRSAVAAMRFAEWSRIKSISGEWPLMLIDDAGVSLDRARREKLLEELSRMPQVFLTSTEEI